MTNEELMEYAKKVQKNAICQYTNTATGVALLAKSGKVYTGCNIEHSISGLATCAEKVAFAKAISEGESEFEKIAVVGGKRGQEYKNTWIPCLSCIQYMLDFVDDIIVVCYMDSKLVETHLADTMFMKLNVNRKVTMRKHDKDNWSKI